MSTASPSKEPTSKYNNNVDYESPLVIRVAFNREGLARIEIGAEYFTVLRPETDKLSKTLQRVSPYVCVCRLSSKATVCLFENCIASEVGPIVKTLLAKLHPVNAAQKSHECAVSSVLAHKPTGTLGVIFKNDFITAVQASILKEHKDAKFAARDELFVPLEGGVAKERLTKGVLTEIGDNEWAQLDVEALASEATSASSSSGGSGVLGCTVM